MIKLGTKTKKYIYLTFDDGPLNGTQNCYQLCKLLDIKATFFFVGCHAQNQRGRDLVKIIHQGYSQFMIANHSFTHANEKYHSFYNEPEMAMNDFFKAQDFFLLKKKIIRLPGNPAWLLKDKIKATGLVVPLCKILSNFAFDVIGWDLEFSLDRNSHLTPLENATFFYKIVIQKITHGQTFTENHIVLLFHDWMFQKSKELETLCILLNLLKEYFKSDFEIIENYPNLKNSLCL